MLAAKAEMRVREKMDHAAESREQVKIWRGINPNAAGTIIDNSYTPTFTTTTSTPAVYHSVTDFTT